MPHSGSNQGNVLPGGNGVTVINNLKGGMVQNNSGDTSILNGNGAIASIVAPIVARGPHAGPINATASIVAPVVFITPILTGIRATATAAVVVPVIKVSPTGVIANATASVVAPVVTH